MALHVEDVYGVLGVKYPAYDFLLMLDQSSGHGRMIQGSLNEKNISVKRGGQQDKLRDTIIKELGPYQSVLNIGDEQRMIFTEDNDEPFYLTTIIKFRRRMTGARV